MTFRSYLLECTLHTAGQGWIEIDVTRQRAQRLTKETEKKLTQNDTFFYRDTDYTRRFVSNIKNTVLRQRWKSVNWWKFVRQENVRLRKIRVVPASLLSRDDLPQTLKESTGGIHWNSQVHSSMTKRLRFLMQCVYVALVISKRPRRKTFRWHLGDWNQFSNDAI